MTNELQTGTEEWKFECEECSFWTFEDSEVEALRAADKHADYGPGHFNFTITDPDGVEQYP